ncbi:hypothetical protein [Caballeronia sp. LZ032]|nr:hypothetical protein [Caballeronia sp. LZ032]MDR5880764.1 hypothetical protein [Caballeronia sp. LZ032]
MHDAIALHAAAVLHDKAQLDAKILFRPLADMFLKRDARAQDA